MIDSTTRLLATTKRSRRWPSAPGAVACKLITINCTSRILLKLLQWLQIFHTNNDDLAPQPLDDAPRGEDVAQQSLQNNQDEQDSDEKHHDEENVETVQPQEEPIDNEQPFEQQPDSNELQTQLLHQIMPHELADNEPDNAGRVQPKDQDEQADEGLCTQDE